MILFPGLVFAMMAGVFDVRALPIEEPPGTVFFAHADRDSVAELMVIEGTTIMIYNAEHPRRRSVRLEPGVSAFDIADLDGDGRNEVIAIIGERVCRYPIPEEGDSDEHSVLFEQHTMLTSRAPYPAPCVIAIHYQGLLVLALPVEDALELRHLDGTLVERLPASASDRMSGVFGEQFSAQPTWPPVVAAPSGIEFEIQRSSELTVELPDALVQPSEEATEWRRVPASQLMHVAALEPDRWPWFPVRTDASPEERVLFAPAPPGFRDTVIQMRIPETGVNPWSEDPIRLLPPKLYPGLLIPPEQTLPDFNDDGYTDLILWRAPDPGTTVNSLLRTLTGRTWPVYAAVHLYAPDKQRYEPRPSTVISGEVPVFWFITQERGAPFRNRVLSDFNGDGTSDIAWSTTENTFSAWILHNAQTGESPDFHYTFKERQVKLVLTGDLADKQCTSLVLRGEKTHYWLYAKPPGITTIR